MCVLTGTTWTQSSPNTNANQCLSYGVYLHWVGIVQLSHGTWVLHQLGAKREILFCTMQGVNVIITPRILNNIIGTSSDADQLVLIGMKIRSPYQAIRHTLFCSSSLEKWTKHSKKTYHQSLRYAHILREARVRLKIVMHYFISGPHHMAITEDSFYSIYAFMTTT